MTTLHLACALAVIVAIAHSVISERIYMIKLRKGTLDAGVFAQGVPQRLVIAMFHLPSILWAGMGVAVLFLDPRQPGDRSTLIVLAALFAISGIGNFWALRRPHPGGILLLSTAAAILFAAWA